MTRKVLDVDRVRRNSRLASDRMSGLARHVNWVRGLTRHVDRMCWISTLSRRKSLIGVFAPADRHNHS